MPHWTRGKVGPIGQLYSRADQQKHVFERVTLTSFTFQPIVTIQHPPRVPTDRNSNMGLKSPVSREETTEDMPKEHQRIAIEKSKPPAKAKKILLPDRQLFYPDQPLSISRPVTRVIDTANALLYAVNGSTDFAFRYRLVSNALAIGRNLSSEIVNPLSVIRPPAQDIKSTRRLLLLSHSAMIQLLCQENYPRHRELIYEHLTQVVLLEGQEMLYDPIPAVNEAIWPNLIGGIQSQGWTIPRRMREWIRVASTIPNENYFVAGRLYSHNMSLRMEIDALEACIANGNLDESKAAVEIMQYPADVITECLEFICSGHAKRYLPPHPNWDHPEQYKKIASSILDRFYRCKRDVEAHLLLRQGDVLLALATDEARKTDLDYFRFQAKLALDSYRAGYRICVSYIERNFGLEDGLLAAMKRVLEEYLKVPDVGPSAEVLLQGVDRVL